MAGESWEWELNGGRRELGVGVERWQERVGSGS